MLPDNKTTKPQPAVFHRVLRHVPTVLGLGLLGGAIFVVWREARHLKIEQVEAALHGMGTYTLALAALWTFLAYFVLTFYDQLGTIYAGNRVSYKRAAFASFCAYALSHNLGLAAVSGAAVRYRLYSHWGVPPLKIARIVAFCALTFGLGAAVLAGAILWIEPGTVPFFGALLPAWALRAIGTVLWLVVGSYITLASVVGSLTVFGHVIELPRWRMALSQVALATVDVAVTTTIFYQLVPHTHGLTWLRFAGVYLAAYSAGLVANLPGGLGVFDGAMLLGLQPWLDAPHVLSAILVFRLLYYIIPLFLAGSLFAGNELVMRGGSLWARARGTAAAPGATAVRVSTWSEPDFAVATATGVVALCGAMLLALGLLAPRPNFAWIDPDLADVAAEAGQFIPSLIGAGLMVLSVGLSRRVNLAWTLTAVLLVLGTLFSIAEGERGWVTGMLMVSALMIAPFRSAFYRHAHLFSARLSAETVLPLFALIGCLVVLAAFERHVRFFADNAWWEIVMSREIAPGTRAAIAATVAIALFAIWHLIRPGRVAAVPWTLDSRKLLARFGGVLPAAQADGVLLGEAEASGVAFRRCGRILLALGDPVGSASDIPTAIWRFRDLAVQEGRDPAFWNAGSSLLNLYADIGLTALPLESGAHGRSGFLVCSPEKDLNVLLPLLKEVGGNEFRLAEAEAA
jgi:uncharacterized membrane protein YbhN (UPF0104 family)